ncbi:MULTISPECIES: DUF6064 family protein [unclassified Rhizobium]|uniref:DUF6064 family protein n=1 Tax=unclassified Rhizobium TaxID=2613769 RepID=UPI001AE329F6|nr:MULTISPECIES: DUF6064 family protein [unclassified Rhizobium]MBP2460511.1 hypothetical protein [Rhizobium sp. PvP014]MBP2527908.1 hypothetical protein [Rhizobium sp. PvP099]
MTEWWSYRPSDFLMFSPRVYFRQIANFNVGLWPLHLAMVLIGVGLLCLVLRGRPNDRRIVAVTLAVLWLFVAYAYLWMRLSSINWAATYAAIGFGAQAILTVCVHTRPTGADRRLPRKLPGVIVAAVSILAYPALFVFSGRGHGQSEVFGIMPDPTVLATIGLLAASRQRYDFVLFVIPCLWCVVSSVTLYTMHDTTWWVSLAIGFSGLMAAVAERGKT